MNADEVVIINDDKEKDSDIEVIDISKENSIELKSSVEDSIVIDDDAQNENDIIEVIDIDRDTSDKIVKGYLSKVCSENRIIGEFIEKCLDLENTSGMLRVIHRTFLPLYFKMDDAYKESDDFKRLIDVTMRSLDVTPNRKFSHLKSVCEIMKSFDKYRKKAKFITLTTDVKAKPSQRKPKKRKRSGIKNNVYKKAKRKPENIIVLDDPDESQTIANEDTEIPTENSLAQSEDIVVLDDDVDLPNNSNKENNNQSHNSKMSIQGSNSEVSHYSKTSIQGSNSEVSHYSKTSIQGSNSEVSHYSKTSIQGSNSEVSHYSKMSIQGSNSEVNTSNKFLVPQRSEEYMMNEMKASRIKFLEKQIERFKEKIDDLEQQEVNWDSLNSSYIVCEDMKSTIVKLYKELCSLTGSEAIKRREVRLTPTEGRPHLPVKILEELINENIGSDGNPHFPDFVEVVKCVSKANEEATLRWSQSRIMAEARSLFTYCGQALQENRKKREWKYLLSRVNSSLDDDPAENDPALMQRLEANRCIAVKKESDLLDKYVEMEHNCNRQLTPDSNSRITPFSFAQGASDDEDMDNNELVNQLTNKEITTSNHNFNILTTGKNENGNNHSGTEINTSKTIVYGSHKSKSNDQHAINNISDAHKMIKQENIIENDKTSKMHVDENFIEISVPAINKITDTIENDKRVALASELENKQNDKRMIEIYVENNQPPEVKVINLSSSLPLENDKENMIKTSINEELSKDNRTEFDLADNTNEDDPTIATGNIVIKDVYSISTKQEITSFQNNDLDKSDIGESSIENNIQETSMDYTNLEESTEKCENTGVKEVTPILTANNVTISNVKAEKSDVVNNNLIQSIKVESSSHVLKDMQMFGGSFTATIFDIEDPFLVIEISDSSDDSDCDMES